jgi:hypothetical protein
VQLKSTTDTVESSTGNSSHASLSKARLWLHQHLTTGIDVRFHWQGIVTPDKACAMLELNTGNRPISATRVAEHVARLKAGTFILTHQGIAFSKEGELNDGQHRLSAIVESDIGAPLIVWFGCERSEFAVVDQNYSRTAANILSIQGIPHSALRASIAGMVYMLRTGPKMFPRPQEAAAYAIELAGPDLDEACRLGSLLNKVSSPTAIGLAHYWIATNSPNPMVRIKLRDFWANMSTGENISGPKLRLREWLTRGTQHSKHSQGLTVYRAACIINAWNSWASNRKLVNFEWPYSSSLPAVAK